MSTKFVAFCAAVFSFMVPTRVSTPTFVATLAAIGVSATFWYGTAALVLCHVVISMGYHRAKAWIDLTSGGLVIA
ncbi:amino acid transporter [Pandoraea iniqua]|uniref:Amino acid transporter n=1 Tax=Pandoraea iniqua TaxID=2508288 RepID=A0A5E4T056_9BURK|nr:hypothetical protein [Pandoraea iniqua]VVD79968.1 amino acid transporter [Pandoraea iniqua]